MCVLAWMGVCFDHIMHGWVVLPVGGSHYLDHCWLLAGVLTALMGASGAGKTTLMDLLAGTSACLTGECGCHLVQLCTVLGALLCGRTR